MLDFNDPRAGLVLFAIAALLIVGYTWFLTHGREGITALHERRSIRRFKRPNQAWIPAPVGEADQRALLLHDIELATEHRLLVSFDNAVYVTPKQRRQIARYLQGSHFARGEAAEVFARHGYRLITTHRW